MARTTKSAKPDLAALNEDELKAQLSDKPSDPRLNRQMMQLLVAEKRDQEALPYALRALESKRVGQQVYSEVLQLLSRLKLQRLITAIGPQAIRNGLDRPRVSAVVARAQARTGDCDGALSLLDTAQQAHGDNKLLQNVRAFVEKRRDAAAAGQ